jgi:hypothetical protein
VVPFVNFYYGKWFSKIMRNLMRTGRYASLRPGANNSLASDLNLHVTGLF